jgi:hypothetical protein
MLKYKISIIFIFLFCIGFSQVNYDFLSSIAFQKEIRLNIQKVKDKLSCIYENSIEKRILDTTFCSAIDTNLFIYVPIINSYLSIYGYSKDELPLVLSEVLLYSIKEKKIVGSGRFGKDGNIYLGFYNYNCKNCGFLPMRKENKLNYILPQKYCNVTKIIKNKTVGYFLQINETNSLYYISDNKSPTLVIQNINNLLE